MVQLNRTDCLWKLGEDLLQLFVFHPTADLSLPLATLEALYAECFSRKLQTAVYSAKDVQQVLRAKHMKKVIHVNMYSFIQWNLSLLSPQVRAGTCPMGRAHKGLPPNPPPLSK